MNTSLANFSKGSGRDRRSKRKGERWTTRSHHSYIPPHLAIRSLRADASTKERMP